MTILRLLVPSLAVAALVGAEPAVPTATQWTPVSAALVAGTPEAERLLTALATAHPTWLDGWRELARLHLRLGHGSAALDDLAKARAIDANDMECLALQIRALGMERRYDEAYAIVTRSAGRDPKGLLRGEAGLVAAAAGDAGKAHTFLNEAKLRCGPQVPVHLLFLEARIAIAQGELPKAEIALASAVAQNATFIDGWTELGRVRLAQAEEDPTDEALLTRAEDAFTKAAAGDRREAAARIGLGHVRLLRAERRARANDSAGSTSCLRAAVATLEEALLLNADAANAHLLLGRTLLLLNQLEPAATHLTRARELGRTDRDLPFLIATAQQRSGHSDDAEKTLASITLTDPRDQLAVGMDAYDRHDDPQAYRWLSTCANDVQAPAAWRFAGHAAARHAPHSEAPALWYRQAVDAYAAALAHGDHDARRHLLALTAHLEPADITRVGHLLLDTAGWTDSDGWRLLVGAGSITMTGGDGWGGAFRTSPLITLSWLIVGLSSLAGGSWLWWRATRPVVLPGLEPRSTRKVRSTTTSLAPAPRPGIRTRTPAGTPAPHLTPAVKPRRIPTPEPSTEAHQETLMPSTLAPKDNNALERR